eukprot:gene1187-1840_t
MIARGASQFLATALLLTLLPGAAHSLTQCGGGVFHDDDYAAVEIDCTLATDPGQKCSVTEPVGYRCDGAVECAANFSYVDSLQCSFGCPVTSSFTFWQNNLVHVNCDGAHDANDSCSLLYDVALVTCSGRAFCAGEGVITTADVDCWCADICTPSLCAGGPCYPRRVVPDAPGLVPSTACRTASLYSCCDPCATKVCPVPGEYCKTEEVEPCADGTCCKTAVCVGVCSHTTCEPATEPCMEVACEHGACLSRQADDRAPCTGIDGATGSCFGGLCFVGVEAPGTCGQVCEVPAPTECVSVDCPASGGCPVTLREDWACARSEIEAPTGYCTANGVCGAGNEPVDDCNPASPCAETQVCWDADQTTNQVFECRCPPGMEQEGGVCLRPLNATCSADAVAACDRKHLVCVDDDCASKPCPDVGAYRTNMCVLPAGCTFLTVPALTLGSDRCPINPCAFECPSTCTPAVLAECQALARGNVSRGPADGAVVGCAAELCIVAACPVARCPQPPFGCVLEQVLDNAGRVLTDESGCPVYPCGKERCRDECSVFNRAYCSALKPRKACEVLSNSDGSTDPICVPIRCPTAVCDTPLFGCRYAPLTPAQFDASGCPIYPCGALDCSAAAAVSVCTAAARRECAAQRQACFAPAPGREECATRICPAKHACIATVGCRFEPAPELGPDGCPLSPCGIEVCMPLPTCHSLSCDPAVFDSCRLRSTTGDPVCMGESRSCEEQACPEGQECIATPKGSICQEKTVCDGMQCPSGTQCAGNGTACVPGGRANCIRQGLNCTATERCVSVFPPGSIGTKWACVEPPSPSCDADACSCAGEPCAEPGDCTVFANGSFACLPHRTTVLDASHDWCSRVVCGEGRVCVVKYGKTQCTSILELAVPVAAVVVEQVCTCAGSSICEPITGRCVAAACAAPCGPYEVCVWLYGEPVCRQGNPCAGWQWPPATGLCRVDADCGDGEVCPSLSSKSLVGAVSEWCACDPRNGWPALCSDTVVRSHRFCVPQIWDCDAAPAVESTERNEWCCAVRQKNCIDPVKAAQGKPAVRFNCEPDPTTPEGPEAWPEAKKQYCCGLGQAGVCPLVSKAAAFDCLSRETWTDDKVAWCCDNQGVGCPAKRFDCFSSPPDTWDNTTVAACCEQYAMGCQRLNELGLPNPYDCSKQDAWTFKKKNFCCTKFGKECRRNKPEYSCDGTDVDTWTLQRRLFCCEHSARGCVDDDETGQTDGPYDCNGNMNALPADSPRREWCCEFREIGCLMSNVTNCSLLAPGDKAVCCLRTGANCEYQCDPELEESMGDDQKTFCCNTKGVACSKDSPPEAQDDKAAVYSLSMRVWWDGVYHNRRDFTERMLTTVAHALLSNASAYPSDPNNLDDLDFEVSLLAIGPLTKNNLSVPTADAPKELLEQEIIPPAAWQTGYKQRLQQHAEAVELIKASKSNPFFVPGRRGARALSSECCGCSSSAPTDEGVRVQFSLVSRSNTDYTGALKGAVEAAEVCEGPLASNGEGFTTIVLPVGGKFQRDRQPLAATEDDDGPNEALRIAAFIVLGIGVVAALVAVMYGAVHGKQSAFTPPGAAHGAHVEGMDAELISYASQDSMQEKAKT